MGKILLVVVVFGAMIYAFFWLLERRRTGRARSRPVPRAQRVVAPDDDEEFLRELERRRRRAARENKPDKPRPDDGPADSGTSRPA